MTDLIIDLKNIFNNQVKINEPLAGYTTFKIGGPVDILVEVKTQEELMKTLELTRYFNVPFFILGGGSNILVSDKGFNGLVIKNQIEGIKITGYGGDGRVGKCEVRKVKIEVQSGTSMNCLVRFFIKEGLEGLEDFLGLPGTVGGAVNCQSHWKGKKVTDYVFEVKKIKNVISSVIFKLETGSDKKELWGRAETALNLRIKTQPLQFPSAGCIFKNIDKKEAERLKTPNLTQSTGYLIDRCNLKGVKRGGAQISTVHANFIVNIDHAKATDVIELISIIRTKVKEKFKVDLKEEIKYLGF